MLHSGDVFVLPRSDELEFGHVGIVLDGTRSPIWTLDQNWPIGVAMFDQRHERATVAGVQRIMSVGPKKVTI